jgi:NTE family protein
MLRSKLLLSLLSFALFLPPATAAVAPAEAAHQRPRVGLVLAGGGARGIAHIGVIKYLEEQGIHIDAVAGTSMGSIIGGLYASGLTAAELEEIARTLDWRYALDDDTPRDRLPFRRKEQDYDFLVGASLRFKDGVLKLPMGAIEGQHLNFVLHDLVAHASRIRDFDKLPIPYRAVAADIVTGEAVVLSQGDLALAMRASMSIPGVFTPVDIDGRLLVDGGIAMNIPVTVAQSMGVDRLVVVDIGTPLAPREKLDNVLSLVDQLTNIMTRSNSEQQLKLMRTGDVLVRPALDAAGITATSFDQPDAAIAIGYAAARALAPQLATLADSREAERLAQRPRLVLPKIVEVRIETDTRVPDKLLRNMITQPLGERLDRDRIESDIADIYGLDEFARVDYDVTREDQGHVLRVHATRNPQGDNVLKLGLNWDQDSRGESEFGLRASWHQRGLNRLGAEWYSAGQLGGHSFFLTQFYQPLDTARLFFADMGYRYEQRQLNLAADGELRARAVVDDHQLELAGGYNISNVARVRAGAFVGTANNDIEIGSPLLSSSSEDDGGWFAELKVDTLDRAYFPGSGVRFSSRFSQGENNWGAEADYRAWESRFSASRSFGRNTFTLSGRWSEIDLDVAGDGLRAITLPSQAFTLGGFLSLSGYTRDSLAGNYLGFASLSYYRRLTDQSLLPVDLPVYAGLSVEAGNTWLQRSSASLDDLIHAGSLFLGVDSPLGPIYLGVGLGEDNQRAVYLQIGQPLD